MSLRRFATALLVTTASAVMPLAVSAPASAAGVPGGVFVTGHDPDFHSLRGDNAVGAQNLIRRAVAYVTHDNPSPEMLFVTSRISPPAGHTDGLHGMAAAGYAPDLASADGAPGVHDLSDVDFNAYDVVVVASDFGGILTQAELDILNFRAGELIDYVNGGGGLVAFAQGNSGAHLTPAGGHFDFLPFLATEVALDQHESDYTVTPFGASLGLTHSDVNGNASHNVFLNTGGMEVVNRDSAGRIMSLATRGFICPGGVPAASVADPEPVVEGNPPTTTALTFTVSLSVAPCGGDVLVGYDVADGTATAFSDYVRTSGALVFGSGTTSQTVTVPINADTDFEADETVLLNLTDATNASIADDQAVGTILNDDSANSAPDCSGVAASVTELWPPNHSMRTVTLAGATDPDGDVVTLAVTGVTQDEPTNGLGDGDTGPDASWVSGATDSVQLRAERSGRGDGRVYVLSYTADDGHGGTCQGSTFVGVRHARPQAPIDSGQAYSSFA